MTHAHRDLTLLKYLVIGGSVMSKTDGEIHHVSA